ncbi:MAG: glucans biosynthesis glucosyltransferase MdoH [Paracoccaceae bacterium]
MTTVPASASGSAMRSPLAARIFALSLAGLAGAGAVMLFLQYGAADGLGLTDAFRAALILASTLWLAWGAAQGLVGLMPRRDRLRRGRRAIAGKTVVLVPVYNEDPAVTFARIAAMDSALRETEPGAVFDFAILSDTRDETIARSELRWYRRLIAETGGDGRIYYRRRQSNTGRKAGNIEDFIRRSGAAYDYAMILDADSLLDAGTIAEMARRMEAAPNLGLLQSLPKTIRARSRFGRAMQFGAAFHAPVFARGLARMQGRSGPFWGHNAMIRPRAFAECCGLPELSGRPPFGGHILSHDFVEAALLARGGWQVRLDEDLEGSYEEAPENIVDHAKRDRRWCQGNLQHSRLLTTPGLLGWSRFAFLQGILAYVAPLFWGGFLIASIFDAMQIHKPDYFPEPYQLFPVFPSDETAKAMGLAIGIFGLLVAPKLLILTEAVWTGRALRFGGTGRVILSTLADLVLSSLIAPVLLMYQVRSVLQVLSGTDGGWPPNNRGDGSLTLAESWAASRFIVLTGGLGLWATWHLAPSLVPWLLPVGLPMLFAPVLIAWTSRPSSGESGVFRVPSEMHVPRIVLRHDDILARWRNGGPVLQSADGTFPV